MVDESKAVPSARFFADLGGESIDFLELSFRLERKLGFKVEFNRLLGGRAIQTAPRGVVTREAIAALGSEYPYLPVERLKPEPTVAEMMDELLTVEAISRFVGSVAASAPNRDGTESAAAAPPP